MWGPIIAHVLRGYDTFGGGGFYSMNSKKTLVYLELCVFMLRDKSSLVFHSFGNRDSYDMFLRRYIRNVYNRENRKR